MSEARSAECGMMSAEACCDKLLFGFYIQALKDSGKLLNSINMIVSKDFCFTLSCGSSKSRILQNSYLVMWMNE